MNVTMVERNCANCLLRMLEAERVHETEARSGDPDPENAPERQLEQLERSFGANWKW
jgi:hypothetical protein